MDADNSNNNLGTTHTITDLGNVETINFINNETQQDTLDISGVIQNVDVTADNINSFVKITSDGVYVDNSGSGKFSAENQVARFANNSTISTMVAVQVSESLATTINWTENSHIPIEDSVVDPNIDNTVHGSSLNDDIQGTDLNDSFHGSWGDDKFSGGRGADTYIGGAGNDIYVLSDDDEVDKIDFVATDSEQDSLDISNILPEGATSANVSQYIKVTENGVFLDKTGQGNFTADTLIAEFTNSSVFNQDSINLILGNNETFALNISFSSGVQLAEGESYATAEELASRLDTYQPADNSALNSDADVGVIRSESGEKFSLNLHDHNITEAHGGAGDELLDASAATEKVNLYGRDGDDTLVASNNVTDDSGKINLLDGGAGNDRIKSGLGRNLLVGGEGEDEFVLTLEDSSEEIKSDNIYDFSSQEGHRDVINLEQVLPNEANITNIHSYVKVTEAGIFIDVTGKAYFSDDNQLARFGEKSSIDNLINLRLADGGLIQMNRDHALKIIQGDDTDNTMKGGEGSDSLHGGGGDDTLDGDSLANTLSADHLYGDAGNDTIKVDALDLSEGTVDGGTGYDTVRIAADSGTPTSLDMHTSNVEKAFGADSDDTIDGSGYTDTSGGYNKSTGEYETIEAQRLEIYGKGGRDDLKGGIGRDYIDGGDDDDTISGGGGRDFLYGGLGNDTFVLADDNEQYDNVYDFQSNADQHDILDISAFITEDVDTANLQNYFSIGGNYIYFDKSGSGDFSNINNIIAKLGGKSSISEPFTLKISETDIFTFDQDTGIIEQVVANTPVEDAALTLNGIEDTTLVFTEQQLLSSLDNAPGHSISDVSYAGNDGTLTEIPSAINFSSNTDNKIQLTDTLQSINEFSIEFTYTSTGTHSGDIDAIFSLATQNEDNAILINAHADGTTSVSINNNVAVFNELNLNDDETHDISVTWNSSNGELKIFNNDILVGTDTVAQGETIADAGILILGQEQDTYGGRFDASQSLTNGSITHVTMSYDLVDDTSITSGNNLVDTSSNLAFNIVPSENGNVVNTVSSSEPSTTIDGSITANTTYYEFTPNAEFNGDVNLEYTATNGVDQVSQTAKLQIEAVDDATVVTDTSAQTTEDNSITFTKKQLLAGFSDPDSELSLADVRIMNGTATVVENSDGSWTITPEANWAGNVLLAIDANNGTGIETSNLDLTVTATADTPILTVVADGNNLATSNQLQIYEDNPLNLDIAASLIDTDGSENLSVSIAGIPVGFILSDGVNSVSAAGVDIDTTDWDLNNISITPIANHTENFALTIKATATEADGRTASKIQNLTVDMQAVNDVAVITGTDSGNIVEDGSTSVLTTTGVLHVTDNDIGEGQFVAETIEGMHGSVTITADGNWTYTADNSQTAIQQLGESEQLTDTITIITTDGTTHDIQVEITGTNDVPIITEAIAIQGTEDTTIRITKDQLLANTTDVDANDELSVTDVSYTGNDGTLAAVNSIIFATNTNNKIEVAEKMQGMDGFSLEFEYISTGAHSGSDALFSMSTPGSGNDNDILIQTVGSNSVVTINSEYFIVENLNLNDGANHKVNITWDSVSGEVKVYDNNNLVGTQTLSQGTSIEADGWIMLGQEQDNYGGGLDPNQSLTNAEIKYLTLAYDVVSQADIESGTSIANTSSNLALDLRTENGQIVDKANDYSLTTEGSIAVGEHYEFTPNANYNGNAVIDYTISDGTSNISTNATLNIAAVNDAAQAGDTDKIALENEVVVITKEDILAKAFDVEGDSITVTNVSYNGSDGTLTEVHNIVFGDNTDNKVEVANKLQSLDGFSLEFDYKSTGSHSGTIDSIVSMANPVTDNAMLVTIGNDNSLHVTINNSSVKFEGIDLYDGNSHNVTLTWDSASGELKLYDNNQLIDTKTKSQGETIATEGWVVIGQEQDSYYGSGYDASQSLTNAELGFVTLSYDTISQAVIEAGNSIADSSSSLALDIRSENGQVVDKANDYAINTDGSIEISNYYEFTPNAGFNGNVAVDYQLSDGNTTTEAKLNIGYKQHVEGTDTQDTLTHIEGQDAYYDGKAGDDTISDGANESVIIGGGGDDILTGGDGSDHFVWHASDVGTAEAPAEDVITDFHTGENGDVIDLSDILTREANPLAEYLDLNFENGNTTLEVKADAGGAVIQKIILEGVDLSGYSSATTNTDIINNLLDDGNINIDSH